MTCHTTEHRAPPMDAARRARILRALTLRWSSTPEVACRADIHKDGLDGSLYALEREGIVESVKPHTKHRMWRLTERGVAERRDLEATSASTTEE